MNIMLKNSNSAMYHKYKIFKKLNTHNKLYVYSMLFPEFCDDFIYLNDQMLNIKLGKVIEENEKCITKESNTANDYAYKKQLIYSYENLLKFIQLLITNHSTNHQYLIWRNILLSAPDMDPNHPSMQYIRNECIKMIKLENSQINRAIN